jgi:hypothetical protein
MFIGAEAQLLPGHLLALALLAHLFFLHQGKFALLRI